MVYSPRDILIGNGVDPELPEKLLHLIWSAFLLYLPYSLCEGIGSSPCEDPYRTLILLISDPDYMVAAFRAIVLSDLGTTKLQASEHSPASHVVSAWPVAYHLPVLLIIQRHESLLPASLHKIRKAESSKLG